MSNLNRVFLMGRLTRDPELRYTPQGVPVTEIGMAVNREYTAGGERKKDTLFIDVTLWRRQAEICCQYLNKGSSLFVEGRLSMDSWEGQDGQKRVRYRVVADNFQFVGGGGGGGGAAAGRASESGGSESGSSYGGSDSGSYGGSYTPDDEAAAPRGPRPAGEPARSPAPAPEAGEGFGPNMNDDDIPF